MRVISCLLALAAPTAAPGNGGCCDVCGTQCSQYRLVARKVRVPVVVTETRLKSSIVEKMEERKETYTVFKRVPVTQKIMTEKCFLDTEIKTKTITKKKPIRVKNPVLRAYPVTVPYQEIEHSTVQREGCSGCGKICDEQPCTRCVIRERTEIRSDQCEREDVVIETTKRDISYCVKVPKMRKELCLEETIYKLVPVEKTRTVTVCVPEVVKTPVETKIRKMVTKTVYCCEKCNRKH